MQSTQTIKRPNPKGSQYQSRTDVKSLTAISKNLYPLFDNYELQQSRLKRNSQFNALLEEIKMFNAELVKWKENRYEIRNLVVTYHLYENLYSRLRYISSFCRGENESNNAIAKTTDWFFQQKPKLRCLIKQNHACMKNLILDSGEEDKMNRFLQNTLFKKDFQPYQLMSRTIHPDAFPPKLELKQFKRKQFLPYSTDFEEENQLTRKKRTSASLLSKNKLTQYRNSVGTMMTANTFKESKESFHKTVSQFCVVKQRKNNEGEQMKNEQREEISESKWNEQIQEIQRQNLVQKQQLVQNNIVQNVHEQDELCEDENMYDHQQKREKKLFVSDFDKSQREYVKELTKQAEQSSLRRVFKINEDKIKSKLQNLDDQRNMLNWEKIKGKTHREQARKLEVISHGNKFDSLTFERQTPSKREENVKLNQNTENFMSAKTNFHKDSINLRNPFRGKSLSQGCLEIGIEKAKIKDMLKTFGKYLNHLPPPQNNDIQEGENMESTEENERERESARSMSLTNISSKQKKKSFSQIIAGQSSSKYNSEVHEEILRIKTSLAKKGTVLEKGAIFKALSSCHPDCEETQGKGNIFNVGKNLLSNPFFPKDKSKNKKKKL